MGVKYSASDSALLMEAMTNNVQLANEVTDRLSSGCNHLIATLNSGELQGAAYTAGQGLFSEIIIPSIQKLQAAVDDIQTELNSYRSADSIISGFGSLDLEQLKKLKKLKERQLKEIQKQISDHEDFFHLVGSFVTGNIETNLTQLSALYTFEDNLALGIKELQDKIEKLEWFVAEVSNYFSDSLSVLNLAIQGATQLSQIVVDSNGNYYTDGLDMNWLTKLKDEKIENHTLEQETAINEKYIEKQTIVKDYVETYGLDKDVAEILYNLQQNILEKAKNKGWSKEKILYEYNRLIASVSYARTSWAGVAGTLKEPDLSKALEKYGLDQEDIGLLKDRIGKQHTNGGQSKDLVHEAVQIAAFTKQSISDRDLSKPSGWSELLASIASKVGNRPMTSPGIRGIYEGIKLDGIDFENYESSLKGDIDSGRYDDGDFNSDLDAMNYYNRVQKETVKNEDIFRIQAQYNHEVATNQLNRVDEFYTHLGHGDKTAGKEILNLIVDIPTPGQWYIGSTRTKSEEQSVSDFYDYLERGGERNVGT
ncbi:MAG: ATP-binding protein [Streptococcus sp.]|nr:ATP-binding protein [Streptococcus sp.]